MPVRASATPPSSPSPLPFICPSHQNNHNFGTTSHCRVPMKGRAVQQRVSPDVQTGCISCASGDGRCAGDRGGLGAEQVVGSKMRVSTECGRGGKETGQRVEGKFRKRGGGQGGTVVSKMHL